MYTRLRMSAAIPQNTCLRKERKGSEVVWEILFDLNAKPCS